jgi:quercetin dioxygenase-like cupin family protein
MAEDGSAGGEADEEFPFYVEVWNDYDPSMRFAAIFPVGEDQGATASSVAYYIIEPGRHTGVHSDNAEEIIFVTEGEGELFAMGRTERLAAGKFHVLATGLDHDIYAQGAGPLRLLSFFPTPEVISRFQQVVYPVGGHELSSKPPRPVLRALDPDDLPEGFPAELAELGTAPVESSREPTITERLIGLAPRAPADSPAAPESTQTESAEPDVEEPDVAGPEGAGSGAAPT